MSALLRKRVEELVDELRRQHMLFEGLREALKSNRGFLSHCWRDVNMNTYSLELLQKQMTATDAALAKAEKLND
jgi:hypothetical protein